MTVGTTMRGPMKQPTQREIMRRLAAQHGYNREKTCAAYIEAERRGEVPRKEGRHIETERYAAKLWGDGIRKGWLKAT